MLLRALILWFIFAPLAAAQTHIRDGDTIEIGEKVYRINGIDAPERAQLCDGPSGEWRCGDAATEKIEALLRGRHVACVEHESDAYGRIVATCHADGVDIGAELVREGLAWAYVKYSDAYVAEEAAARSENRGVWRATNRPAWEYRAARWSSSSQEAPKGCAIKGNISLNGRIYHAPWSRWYDRTRVDTSSGERWFCDEAEAIAAGWRAPRAPRAR